MPQNEILLFADSNIVALAVRRLRNAGYDVVYAGELPTDPGDAVLLEEAENSGRVLITKDHDIGALVFRDGKKHTGVLLIDDLGSAEAETKLLIEAIAELGRDLSRGAFLRKP